MVDILPIKGNPETGGAEAMVKLTDFGAAEHLADEEDREFFLAEARATDNPAYIVHAADVVARSRKLNLEVPAAQGRLVDGPAEV